MLRAAFAVLLVVAAASSALAERRVALVFADDDYRSLRPLANAVNDGRAIEQALEKLHFEVSLEPNRDLRRMKRALDDFRQDGAGADVALVFFSGHGVEIGGENRLLPVDAQADSVEALKQTSLPLEDVRVAVNSIAGTGLIILDACRNDPFGTTGGGEGRGAVALRPDVAAAVKPGLGRIGRADNVLFAFSAAPGQTASDGSGGNSPFSAALAKYLGTDGLEIRSVMTLVQQEVYDQSRGRQLPYVESGLPKLFFASSTRTELPERERLLLAMADIGPDVRAQVEQIAADADMPLAPLYGALIGADAGGLGAADRVARLREAADAFVKVRDELKSLSAADPEVQRLRDEANRQLALGAFAAAREKLGEAADIDSRSRQALKANFVERTLSEADTRAISGGAARADLRYDLAIEDYVKAMSLYDEAGEAAFAPAPADRRMQVLEALGVLYTTVGNIGAAGDTFELLTQALERRAAQDPADPSIRRDLAIAHTKRGNAEMAQGRLEPALADYRQARTILAALVGGGAQRAKWLGDYALADDKIAEVLMAAGDLPGALQAMEEALASKRELAGARPGDAGLQRDLTISYDAIGDALSVAGDWANAETAYRASLDIRTALAQAAPENAERQRDLSVSQDHLGDVLRAAGDRDGALAAYGAGLDIITRLAARDPQDTQLSRDIAVGEGKIGNVLRDGQDLEGALAHFAKALAITRGLAARDGGNTDWQRDLSVTLEKVADIMRRKGDRSAALAGYEESLPIVRRLAQADPDNADWQRDLSITLAEIGNLRFDARDFPGARDAFAESLDIRQRLARSEPANTLWQRDLIMAYNDYAQVAPDPKGVLGQALDLALQLQREGRLSPREASMIDVLKQNLARLKKRRK